LTAPAHAGAADRGSDAPTDELSGDEFAFDLDDLGTDSDAGDGSREQSASPDAALDDLADAPAADASHDDAARVADAVSHEAGLTGHDDAAAAGTDRPVLATAEGDLDFDLDGDEFDFNSAEEGDEISTKLELARAYVDMGDEDGAREILGEVVRDGDDTQKQEAGNLLQQLG
jgi:pilus assembly protein FimV